MVHQPSGGFQGQASDIALHAQEIIDLKKRLNMKFSSLDKLKTTIDQIVEEPTFTCPKIIPKGFKINENQDNSPNNRFRKSTQSPNNIEALLNSNYYDKNNSINKSLLLLRRKKFIEKKTNYQIVVKKNIPVFSGLGGGSSNAASIIQYFLEPAVPMR